MPAPKNKDLPRGTVIGVTTSKQVTVRLRVRPLPPSVTEFLETNSAAIRRLYAQRKAEEDSKRGSDGQPEGMAEIDGAEDNRVSTTNLLSATAFKKALLAAFAENEDHSEIWENVVDNITAFGPRRTGPNLLIDNTESKLCRRL